MNRDFKEYQHIERLDTEEVEGILDGDCYIFTKLDGMQTSIWHDEETIRCGIHHSELTPANEKEGRGFWAHVFSSAKYCFFFQKYPNYRLFGEWLIKHQMTYTPASYNKFYVFDVVDIESGKYIPYEEYIKFLRPFLIDYIPLMRKYIRPTTEQLQKVVKIAAVFCLPDGVKKGEGIVIKRYNFVNKYGRVTWAKLVNPKPEGTFSRKSANKDTIPVEEHIVEQYCTEHLIDKIVNKIADREGGGWHSKYIPELLGRVKHDIITEEIWSILKRFKNPTIDFGLLQRLIIIRVKILKSNLFN